MTSNLMLHFNAPIGYSKTPLLPKPNMPRTLVQDLYSPPPPQLAIDKLPKEIRVQIASELNQYDKLSLAQTNKAFAQTTLPHLYRKIVVDSCYTEFTKEYDFSCTYINLLYSFKKFIRFQGNHHIHELHVLSLPDLTNTYDTDVNNQLLVFFGHLHHLKHLVWLLDNFRLEFLRRLPDHALVARLLLNVKFSNYLGEPLAEDGFFFPNLVSLHVRPFHNLKRLVKLVNVLVACDGNVCSQLQSLKLARFDKDTTVLVPPVLELNHPPQGDDHELDTIEAVFSRRNLRRLPGLTELSFNNILVGALDGVLLAEAVNLAQLRRLELRNVLEHGDSGFLGHLAPFLAQLTHLHLDYRETHKDTVGGLLEGLCSLQALDLVVRINDIKRHNVDVEAMYADYAFSILKQVHLTKLSIEVREENSFCDVVRPTPIALFGGLHGLRLRSLRLNSGETAHGVDILLDLLQNLKELEVLDVFGQKAGGAPHLGLGMAHPNIYDEWFKVQHVALLYWQAQCNLRYVRINKCIFEYTEGVANPRDVIDRWFEGQVRVGFS